MFRTDLSRANSLVQLVSRARRVTPWFVAPFIAIAIIGGIAQFASLLGLKLPANVPGAALFAGLFEFFAVLATPPLAAALKSISAAAHAKWLPTAQMIMAFGFVWLMVYLWVRLVEWRPFHTIGLGARHALGSIALGVLLGLLSCSLVVVGLMIGGILHPRLAEPGTVGTPMLGAAAVLLLAFVVQASSEEALYRGFLMNVVSWRLGPAAGIGISTLLFAIAHSRNPGFNALAGINLVLFALFLALLSLRTGSIWAACAWHAVWNWSMANLWGLPLSGQPPDIGSILAWEAKGLKLWTGGEWGPEGGLATTIVLTLGVVAMALWRGLGDPVTKEARVYG